MEIFGLSIGNLDQITAVGVVALVALAVITDKLVWHTRLKEAEARAERWESVALEALTVGAKAGVEAAEITRDMVAAFPDPGHDRREQEG